MEARTSDEALNSGRDKSPDKILIADDDPDIRALLRSILMQGGYAIIEAEDGIDALAKMSAEISLALIDNDMPRLSGIECLQQIKKKFATSEVIMLSVGGVADAVAAMRNGAYWYLQKPIKPEELLSLLRRAKEVVGLRDQRSQLIGAVTDPATSFDSAATYILPPDLKQQIDKIAARDSSVLITGETGTGKSVLARMVHQMSSRRNGPFIALSCAALPRDLMEAELFGYERGAFTGAVKTRPGRVELADKGTLFLDEIGELPLDLQPKLLTFLEDHSVQRIGGTDSKKVDLRIIAATLQDLDRMCEERSFRVDLYFRLKVMSVYMPPLRKRVNEIPLLVERLLNRLGARYKMSLPAIEPAAMKLILEYPWPGNIRELENCLERALLLCDDSRITKDHLMLKSSEKSEAAVQKPYLLGGVPLEELERQAITQTIELCGGNKKEAARRLGISEKSIYNKLQRYELAK